MLSSFWNWYEKHKTFNTGLAAGLFLLQIIHLIWLALHIVSLKLTGQSHLPFTSGWELALAVVDYTEIPALLTTTLLYLSELRKRYQFKPLLYLFLINSQWFHLFWITDEVVLEQLIGSPAVILPLWLSLLAIAVDYLEVPVIIDTTKRFLTSLKNGKA